MAPQFLFPDVVRGGSPAFQSKGEIAQKQLSGERLRGVVGHGGGTAEFQHAKGAQRRSVVLWPRPFQNIERAVRIISRLAQRAAGDRADFAVGPDELQKMRFDPRSEIAGFLKEGAPIERTEREAEGKKILEYAKAFARGHFAAFDEAAQRIDDDRGIAQPVKEIIGVGVIGGEDRRSQDRSLRRTHEPAEAATLLDEIGS